MRTVQIQITEEEMLALLEVQRAIKLENWPLETTVRTAFVFGLERLEEIYEIQRRPLHPQV